MLKLYLKIAYYAGIMLNALPYQLCQKLCWHNRCRPNFVHAPKKLPIKKHPITHMTCNDFIIAGGFIFIPASYTNDNYFFVLNFL